jgi:NAD(P)H-dependent FMN reductase
MTTDVPHVVAISGSLREGSFTNVALRYVLGAAERAGASTDLVDLQDFELPLLDPDAGDAGDAPELRERVGAADAIVLGTPVYHGSYSSVLKTALDYLSREEFGEQTVGLLAVAGGSFPVTALDHLRIVCRSLGAWVVPHQAAVPSASAVVEGSTIVDDALVERIERLGQEVVAYAAIDPTTVADEHLESVPAAD